MSKSNRVSQAEFIRVWDTSNSVAEVAEITGLAPSSAQQRAGKYRTQGIPLKKMARGGKRIDVDAANKLLAEIRGVSVDEIKAAAAEQQAEREARQAAKETV